jgi:exonuclease SbcD
MALADTHLGFDLPARPRIERRRRGHDFFANFEHILDVAVSERVDCVVHGGDLLYRSRVPAELVQKAFLPIKRVANSGIPVFIVPGNHERSHIPFDMLAHHEGVHIFDRPRTFYLELGGKKLAVAGFPYCRDGVRSKFRALVTATQWRETPADAIILCVHHCFEGATVGAHNFTFRNGRDVVRVRDVPEQFSAVITGHVHRAQVLQRDLRGQSIPTPIIYPGAVERTSFAERDEEKGYVLLDLVNADQSYGLTPQWEFRSLSTRPMILRELSVGALTRDDLEGTLPDLISELPDDAVLRVRIHGTASADARPLLTAAHMRELAPPTMNIEVLLGDERNRSSRRL